MTAELLDRRASLRRIIAGGIETALDPAGFEKAGRLSWIRRGVELQHVVALLDRRGRYIVQWGVVSPETIPIIWGRPGVGGDVGDAVMSGTPSSIRHPAPGGWFALDTTNDAEAVDRIAKAVFEDMLLVEERLGAFGTRRSVREYLLANRDRKDPRDFVIPSNLPLKLFTAAVLAIVDRDPVAYELMSDVEAEMSRFRNKLALSRMKRLKAAAADLCG
jgi:hypothetical protein